MIISIEAKKKKILNKTQYPFMIKTFNRLPREKNFLNLIIASTKKQTKNPSNIIIIGERQSFLL